MPEFTIRVKVDSTGKVVSAAPERGAAAMAAQVGGDTEAMERQALSIARHTGRAPTATGRNVPWFLDPSTAAGSALRRVTEIGADPLASGAEQAMVTAREGARLSAYGAALATSGGDKDIANAIANAVGAAVEKSMQKVTRVGREATGVVQDIAADFATVGHKLPDKVLRELYDAEKAAASRRYDARVRAAAISGNIFAPTVGGIQADVARIGEESEHAVMGRKAAEAIMKNMEKQKARDERAKQGR